MLQKHQRLPPRIDLSNESKVMAKNSSSPQLLHGVESLIPTSSHLMKKKSEPYRASCRTLVSPHERTDTSTRMDPNNNNYQFGKTFSINSLTKLRSFRPKSILIQDDASQSYSLPSLNIKPSVRQTPAVDGSSGFQKEGFETLLSFYKDSSSKQPGQLNLRGPGAERKRVSEKYGMTSSQSCGNFTNTNSGKRPFTVTIQQNTETNSKGEAEGEAEIKRFIEGLTSAIETLFSANELEKNMGKLLNKRREDFWREMIEKHEPDFVEIYAVDMINFTEKKRSKIEIINAQEMTKQVDEHIKERNILENQAVHLMVYFSKENQKEEQRKLVLNKYCFYFAKNGHFDQDLKGEKDVIIFYFLLLALYEIRVGQSVDSLKNLKPSLYRERAVNIMKGTESSSKAIHEKIKPKIYNYCIIQKTYFNLNHAGTATSIYILNVLSVVASKYAKLVLAGLKRRSDSEKSLSQVKKITMKQKARTFFAKNLSLAETNRFDTIESKNSFLIPSQKTPLKAKSGIFDLKSPVSIQRYEILNRSRMDTQESNQNTNTISIMETTAKLLNSENLNSASDTRTKYKKLTTPSVEKLNQRFEISPNKIGRDSRRVDRQISTDERSIGKFSIMLPKPKINKLISPKTGQETSLTPWGDLSSYIYDFTPKVTNHDPYKNSPVVIEENRESAEGATTLRQYIASKINKKHLLISDIVKGSKNL